jgi:hypothetical protein
MSQNISQEFIDIVKKYVSVDDEILLAKKELKKLTETRKTHETYILNYLSSIGENVIEVNGGSILKKDIIKSHSAINKQSLTESLTELLQSSQDVPKFLEYILANRKMKENIKLKRIIKSISQ